MWTSDTFNIRPLVPAAFLDWLDPFMWEYDRVRMIHWLSGVHSSERSKVMKGRKKKTTESEGKLNPT